MYYVYPKGLPNQVLGWFPERKNAEAFQMLDCENREIAEWYKTTKSSNTYDVGRGAENLSYLEPLSEQAKAFIIAEKKAGNKNIYHSIMSVFDNRLKKNVMEYNGPLVKTTLKIFKRVMQYWQKLHNRLRLEPCSPAIYESGLYYSLGHSHLSTAAVPGVKYIHSDI